MKRSKSEAFSTVSREHCWPGVCISQLFFAGTQLPNTHNLQERMFKYTRNLSRFSPSLDGTNAETSRWKGLVEWSCLVYGGEQGKCSREVGAVGQRDPKAVLLWPTQVHPEMCSNNRLVNQSQTNEDGTIKLNHCSDLCHRPCHV